MRGTGVLYLTADATIMIRIELPIPARATQPRGTRPERVPAG
jgi:hypothetical protein